ncbi:DUF664 domain-containing protein [Nonomuraea sp. GTA35]
MRRAVGPVAARAAAPHGRGGARPVIQEYARHNGHADLLRERLDGATGH